MAALRMTFLATDGTSKSRQFGDYNPSTINEQAARDLANLMAALHMWRDEDKDNQYEEVTGITLIETTRTNLDEE
ncbi:hypothetical protein [Lacticaseibacillus hegangensis]|uniref:DUF1659 domain-containing protein n=1 Tax=Lacticaseibacillus hegangensis TaxID=2486010 RepID=A0ABW4D0R0_9LACO|nr:hypothetical protein [Lacticaseibacillus hegangensis]